MKEKINYIRVASVSVIAIATIIFTSFFCYFQGFYPDEYISVFFIDFIFLMIFIFELEFERIHKKLDGNVNSRFTRIAIGYVICIVICCGIINLPIYCKPVIILPLIMCSVSNEIISLISSLFFNVLISMIVSGDYYELLANIIITVFGVMIAKLFRNKKLYIYACILIICFSIGIPELFYYWNQKSVDYNIIYMSAIGALAVCVVCYVLFNFVFPETTKSIDNLLIEITTELYPQVRELREYSLYEYEHANIVSDIAYRCAKECNLNPNLCAAGGFYYRLGKWLGEPYVKKGTKRAEDLCFPQPLVDIISEYYGEEKLPSTPESALVHMVDALVFKMRAVKEEDVGKNAWNNELIIVQILNEFSSSGLYDESNLGMNQFMKIRDFLKKEDLLH